MTTPDQPPYAVFSGALGDRTSGAWIPAQAVIDHGLVTLWVATPSGWVQQFSLPAGEVAVKSAAQRITLVVRGQKYPILAYPGAVGRAFGLNGANIAASAVGSAPLDVASTAGRAANQVGAAHAFSAGGGTQFLAAARASGARVSRLSYGAIMAIGCGGALIVVVAVLVITTLLLTL